MRIASLEVRRYAVELDPPFRAAWDPEPRRRVGGEPRRSCARRTGRRATPAATTSRTRRCSSGCWSAWTRAGPRWCASCARPSTSTTDGRGAPRSPCGTSPRGWRASRCGAYLGGPQRADPGLRVERRARRARGARAAGARAARGRRAGGEAPLPPRRLARRRRGRRGRARGRRRFDGDHGRRQPRLADARRPGAAVGRPGGDRLRPRARAARRVLAGGAAAGGRRRGLRAAARGDLAAARRGRDGPEPGRGARPGPARRRRRRPARRGARGRDRRRPADRGARGPVRADVVAAHVVQRARAAGQPAPRARRLRLPVPRGPARPARLDARRGATGCSGGDVAPIAPDGTVGPPDGPGLGVVPDLEALEAHRIA